MMDAILMGILAFLASLVPNLLIFIALCFVDVGLGIAASIKRREFQWRRVGDFYYSMVLPYLMGWFIFASAGAFVIDKLELLGEYKAIASTSFVWGTWMFLVAALISSIGSNFKELYGREMITDERLNSVAGKPEA